MTCDKIIPLLKIKTISILLVFLSTCHCTEQENVAKKVAIVTGANKGVGYEIVKGLCQQFQGDVYLTARNKTLGLEAVESLNKLGYKPKFHVLDITDTESVKKLRDEILHKYGGIDVLVNNAAIAFKVASTVPFGEQAMETLRVNYFSLINTCNILFPILKPHARVVNLTSSRGHLQNIPNKKLRKALASDDLTEEELTDHMNTFIDAAKNDTFYQLGFPTNAYCMSKVGVSAMTRIQQKRLANDTQRPDIVINHVHPGLVATNRSSNLGQYTPEYGAQAPIYAALLPENTTSPKGDYIWHDKKIVCWIDGPRQLDDDDDI